MHREYELNGGKHNTAFLLVAVSQVIYIVMEFFLDEVCMVHYYPVSMSQAREKK